MATTKAAFPPGGTWFDTLPKSFVDVPIDTANGNAIPTSDFLEAAESLTTLFGTYPLQKPPSSTESDFPLDLLGSIAFTPVKNDMLGNIKKVRDRQLASPDLSSTLQSLVLNELKSKKHTATEGLLWLVRGLDFTSTALRHNQSNPSAELSTSFRTAYGTTLKPHHSFMVKPIFSAAMSATPYKKDFYAKMSKEEDEGKVREQMGRWLDGLEEKLKVLREFMARKEAQW
ncbi:MAG: hypothetical protein LQ338_006644 [Usnochroma carphineum]|nr:MAG: hypothetical protein LQ338_006644 [Usnochroma carphineum]